MGRSSLLEINTRGILTIIGSLGLILTGLSIFIFYPTTDLIFKIAEYSVFTVAAVSAVKLFHNSAAVQSKNNK